MAYLFTEILMITWHSDIEEALWKNQGKKLKIQRKYMTSTSLLMFSPEFSLEKELCNTSFLSSHT